MEEEDKRRVENAPRDYVSISFREPTWQMKGWLSPSREARGL